MRGGDHEPIPDQRRRRVVEKHQLDELVASELDLPRRKVREITTAFLVNMVERLVEFDVVHLPGLGRLRLSVHKGQGARPTFKVGKFRPGESGAEFQVRVLRKFVLCAKKSDELGRILKDRYGPSAVKEERHGQVRRRSRHDP